MILYVYITVIYTTLFVMWSRYQHYNNKQAKGRLNAIKITKMRTKVTKY